MEDWVGVLLAVLCRGILAVLTYILPRSPRLPCRRSQFVRSLARRIDRSGAWMSGTPWNFGTLETGSLAIVVIG